LNIFWHFWTCFRGSSRNSLCGLAAATLVGEKSDQAADGRSEAGSVDVSSAADSASARSIISLRRRSFLSSSPDAMTGARDVTDNEIVANGDPVILSRCILQTKRCPVYQSTCSCLQCMLHIRTALPWLQPQQAPIIVLVRGVFARCYYTIATLRCDRCRCRGCIRSQRTSLQPVSK